MSLTLLVSSVHNVVYFYTKLYNTWHMRILAP